MNATPANVETARYTAVASHMFASMFMEPGCTTFNSVTETMSEVFARATADMVRYAEVAGVTVAAAHAEVKGMVDAA